MADQLPSVEEAKSQARAMRAQLAERGEKISHAKALEAVAHGLGFRDWNALFARIKDVKPMGWQVGGRVTGRYLSQPFAGRIIACRELEPEWYWLELELDDPVDVVTSEGFSNNRKRVRGRIGPKLQSPERTSDGVPHLVLDRPVPR